MNKIIDISIIIINWNTKDFLLNCISSIQASIKEKSFEIIVVDNDSTDGSQQALRHHYPNVILIENDSNLGFAKANNIGIEASQGRYVCLVNSDIVVLDDCFDKLVAYMEDFSSIGIIGPKLLNADLSLQLSCKRFPSLWNNFCLATGLSGLFHKTELFCGEHMQHFNHDEIIRTDALVGAFLMVRRSAINTVGLLDERFFFYGEEIDWCRRFWSHHLEIGFFPDAQVIHYGAGSSAKEPLKFYKQLYISKVIYYQKHFSKASLRIMLLIQMLRQALRIATYHLHRDFRRKQHPRGVHDLSTYKEVLGYLRSKFV